MSEQEPLKLLTLDQLIHVVGADDAPAHMRRYAVKMAYVLGRRHESMHVRAQALDVFKRDIECADLGN